MGHEAPEVLETEEGQFVPFTCVSHFLPQASGLISLETSHVKT